MPYTLYTMWEKEENVIKFINLLFYVQEYCVIPPVVLIYYKAEWGSGNELAIISIIM